jgi:hypothetical protein
MKIFQMDLKKAEELALKYGFKPAPKDHPIYREGVTISFVQNTRPKRAVVKQETDTSNKNNQNGE